MPNINKIICLGALALASSHAGAQEQVQPTPEADSGPPYVTTPAPFATTVWRAGARGELRLTGALAGYRGPLVARDFSGKTVWRGNARNGHGESGAGRRLEAGTLQLAGGRAKILVWRGA